MKRTIRRYGVISGIVLIATGWLNYLLLGKSSYQAAELGGYVSIVIALSVIYFGIRYYRDRQNQGHISFRQAFNMGLGMSLISSTFMFFSTVIFFALEGDKWKEWALENMSAEQAEQYANAPEWMMHPAFQGIVMFLTVLVMGLVISLISAMILKKETN